MFVIVKGKERYQTENRQTLSVYLANGWTLKKEVAKEVVKQVEKMVNPIVGQTKKELQNQLNKKGIEYTPRDNKDTLRKKLEQSDPADDFNDGLLKG
jgi:hypothetical protein